MGLFIDTSELLRYTMLVLSSDKMHKGGYMDTVQEEMKARLLARPIRHIDFTSFDSRPIINQMQEMGFTSRDTARATRIWEKMLDDDCTVYLTIAGSTSAAGCMQLYVDLVRHNMVDIIVATGASIVDMDFFEALGFKHYRAQEVPADTVLRDLRIDRIYDTYINEEELQVCDETIRQIAAEMDPGLYSSRAFIHEMGRWCVTHAKKHESLVQVAYEHGVPIICPAFVDSSAGFGLVKQRHEARKAGRPFLAIDPIGDFDELTELKIKAGTTGLVMIGGGVPKNFTQDIVVCAEVLGHEDVPMHKYAIQITVADARDGACSSSTLKEAGSWGKVEDSQEQMVFAEATSVLPLMASAVYHGREGKTRRVQRWADIFKADCR